MAKDRTLTNGLSLRFIFSCHDPALILILVLIMLRIPSFPAIVLGMFVAVLRTISSGDRSAAGLDTLIMILCETWILNLYRNDCMNDIYGIDLFATWLCMESLVTGLIS